MCVPVSDDVSSAHSQSKARLETGGGEGKLCRMFFNFSHRGQQGHEESPLNLTLDLGQVELNLTALL